MGTIVFLMYHGKGHFHAVSAMARMLAADSRVVFAGHAYFAEDVRKQGFEYHPLHTLPFGLNFEAWMRRVRRERSGFAGVLRDRWSNRLFHERRIELRAMLDQLTPSLILIDAWQSTDFVALYERARSCGIRLAFIQTMIPMSLRKALPSPHSMATTSRRGDILRSHLKFHLMLHVRRLREWLKYGSRTNSWMLREAMKSVNVDRQYWPLERTMFAPAFANVDEFVLLPKAFDFDAPGCPAWRHYIGFLPDLNRYEDAGNPGIEEALTFSARTSRPLIYCSFGTVAYENKTKLRRLIKILVRVLRADGYVGVFSAPDEVVDPELTRAEGLYFFPYVPQLRVLSHASVFITHGGLNSIREAIYRCVPLLVYPFDANVDHRGNTGRVVFHKLGLSGDIASESEQGLREKIAALLASPDFRKNLSRMRDSQPPVGSFQSLIKNIQPVR